MIRGTETILIARMTEGEEDRWGNPVLTEQLIAVDEVLVAFNSTSTEYGLDRTLITSAVTLYLPPGTDVEDQDEFIVRGERYRKDGEAQRWVPPAGFSLNPPVVVALRRAGD